MGLYTRHAEEQLLERNVSKAEVEEAVEKPDELLKDSFGTNIAHKKLVRKGKAVLLRVFYDETAEGKKILTVYLTTKISKYYRGWNEGSLR